jgi:pimeloyl-ACP methyl ester carboxylesterase
MQAFAKAGYLVMAPNHKDAVISGPRTGKQPAIAFKDASDWNDNTYRDRHDDIVGLIDQLKKDPLWKKRIDWSKVALCGHSLGGYTVLGLAGAWPSWKQKGIKAVLALSPYTEPYVVKGDLGNINIPVMYQGGRRDFGITPIVKNSAFAKTSSPAYFVEFNNMGHLGWTNYDQDPKERALIAYYCLSFLDKYLKHDPLANPEKKQLGVSEIRSK